jgi:hypothetical protein
VGVGGVKEILKKNRRKKRHRKLFIKKKESKRKKCLHFGHKICNNYWNVLNLK